MASKTSTTLVDLKAELFKRREERKRKSNVIVNVDQIKDSRGDGSLQIRQVSDKTASLWKKKRQSRREDAISEESSRPPLGSDTSEDDLLRSRLALEAKVKIYDEMSKGQGLPDEESNLHGDLCLVDFERKPAPVEQIFEQKEELSYPMAEDFATPTSAVHYQHIHDNEIRDHGVAYYKFSENEMERQEQLTTLKKLRQQTKDQRVKSQKIKEKRESLLKKRLEKVRTNKLGLPAKENDSIEEGVTEIKEVKIEGEEDRDVIRGKGEDLGTTEVGNGLQNKRKYVRPWDKGKPMNPTIKWKRDLENERNLDFAPPSQYFVKGPTFKPTTNQTHPPDIETHLPSAEPGTEPNPPGIETHLFSVEPHPPGIETHLFSVEPHPPGIETHLFSVEPRPPGTESHPPGIETHLSSVEPRPPGTESHPPGIETHPPSVGTHPPSVGSQPSRETFLANIQRLQSSSVRWPTFPINAHQHPPVPKPLPRAPMEQLVQVPILPEKTVPVKNVTSLVSNFIEECRERSTIKNSNLSQASQ